MNNEIKEILDNIYKIINFPYCPFFIKKLGYKELKKLFKGGYNEKY